MRELNEAEQKIVEKGWLYHLGNRRPIAVDYDFYEAGFIAALDHTDAQIAALQAERDGLREALKPFAKVGELVKPLEFIAATDTYLWKQDSTNPTETFGITLADCIEAWRMLGEE